METEAVRGAEAAAVAEPLTAPFPVLLQLEAATDDRGTNRGAEPDAQGSGGPELGIDAIKLRSSMALFAHPGPDQAIFRQVIGQYLAAQIRRRSVGSNSP